MTSTLTDERVVTSTDKPESAHIVLERGTEKTAHAWVMLARIEGFAVTALCGYTWVPTKQATGLPVCAECKALYENDPRGQGDRGDLPDE